MVPVFGRVVVAGEPTPRGVVPSSGRCVRVGYENASDETVAVATRAASAEWTTDAAAWITASAFTAASASRCASAVAATVAVPVVEPATSMTMSADVPVVAVATKAADTDRVTEA